MVGRINRRKSRPKPAPLEDKENLADDIDSGTEQLTMKAVKKRRPKKPAKRSRCRRGVSKKRNLVVTEEPVEVVDKEEKAKELAARARRLELIRTSDAYLDYGYPIIRRCVIMLTIQIVIPAVLHVVTSAKGPITIAGWLYHASIVNALVYRYHISTCKATNQMYPLMSRFFYVVVLMHWASFIMMWQPFNRILDYIVYKYKLPCYYPKNMLLEATWKTLACIWYLCSLYSCGLAGNYWIGGSKIDENKKCSTIQKEVDLQIKDCLYGAKEKRKKKLTTKSKLRKTASEIEE